MKVIIWVARLLVSIVVENFSATISLRQWPSFPLLTSNGQRTNTRYTKAWFVDALSGSDKDGYLPLVLVFLGGAIGVLGYVIALLVLIMGWVTGHVVIGLCAAPIPVFACLRLSREVMGAWARVQGNYFRSVHWLAEYMMLSRTRSHHEGVRAADTLAQLRTKRHYAEERFRMKRMFRDRETCIGLEQWRSWGLSDESHARMDYRRRAWIAERNTREDADRAARLPTIYQVLLRVEQFQRYKEEQESNSPPCSPGWAPETESAPSSAS